MSSKKSKKLSQRKENNVPCKQEESLEVKRAFLLTDPTRSTAITISAIFKDLDPDVKSLLTKIHEQKESMIQGNTSIMEEILAGQAQTLQALFHFYAHRIPYCETVEKMQVYSDLLIKMNNNCRKTFLAIQQIKNPSPTTFIKQQNNATNQQVNNDTKTDSEEKLVNTANELLKESKHETVDRRRTDKTSRANLQMAPMGKINRSNNRKRQRNIQDECL